MQDRSEEHLAELFAQIARRLQAERSPVQTQQRVTRAAVDTIGGCDHAAISLIRRHGGITSEAPTDDVPMRADAIQYEAAQGPCLDAIADEHTVVIADLATDERWPAFSRRAYEETGVRSMLSFQLFVQGDTIGALNLYSRESDAFDEHSRAVGAVLAAHAAIAVTAARDRERAEHLDEALETSREIGMAMGVLMARGPMRQDQLLRVAASRLPAPQRQVARGGAEGRRHRAAAGMMTLGRAPGRLTCSGRGCD